MREPSSLTNANACNGDGAVKKQKQERRDLSPLEFPTRSGAGEVYAYEIRILQGFGVGISTYSRQALVERMSILLLLFFLSSTEVAQLLHLADAQPPEVVCKKIQGV